MSAEPDYSDEVAREIDDEIRRIIEEGHDLATRVLREHIDELHRISQILIERETIDKDQFIALLAGESEDAVFPPEPAQPEPVAEPERRPQPKPRPFPLPGAPRCSRRPSRTRLARAANWFLREPGSSGRQTACARRSRSASRAPSVMGVLNVTPDSFSDGGVHFRVEPAVTSAWGMLDAGAAIVDVGGESTRPGSGGVDADEELRRVEPVLADLAGAPVSIDTSKAAVARRALELGVELVNDVTALRGDPELARRRRRERLLSLPDAHAGRAAHDAGRPRLRRRRLRREARFSRSGSRSPSRRGSARSSSASTPASASARRSRTTSSSCAGSTSCVALGRPLLIGFSRKSSLGALTGEPARRAPLRRRSAPPSPPTSAARRSCACTTCASTSRRSRPRGRWRAREDRAARARAARLPRRVPGGGARRPAVPLRRRARGRRARRRRRARARGRLHARSRRRFAR